jgi:carbonic anhydrase
LFLKGLRPTLAAGLMGVTASGVAAAEPRWTYRGELGAAHWADLKREWAVCRQGRRQSPIDIVASQPGPAAPLQFSYRPAPLRIVNDGHTVRVRFANGSKLQLGSGEVLTLQQFHFHTPGGDKLRGEEFPMGMHFLHKGSSGRLVSLVLLFRQGAENPALQALLPHMPAAGMAEQTLAQVQLNPAQWLPANKAYYRYEGSLTAPPCTEGVLWLVMKQPLEVSAAQLAALHRLFPDNARPTQALHGREVLESP